MDIIIQVWWKINKEYGSSKSITFTLEAFDAYTSKRIATSSGTGEASEANMSVLLESAVRNHIDAFDNQMSMWYNNLYVQGREIVLQCKRWDSWENDLETEYEGEELLDVIQNWLEAHTVNGMFNLSDATENMAQFEQVRIPLFNANGVPMDARAFTVELRKYLAKEPYNITSKVLIRGLGEAIIILGEK